MGWSLLWNTVSMGRVSCSAYASVVFAAARCERSKRVDVHEEQALHARKEEDAMTKNDRKIRYAVVGAGNIAQVAVLPAFANAKENSQRQDRRSVHRRPK
jgi:hypothetical protein